MLSLISQPGDPAAIDHPAIFTRPSQTQVPLCLMDWVENSVTAFVYDFLPMQSSPSCWGYQSISYVYWSIPALLVLLGVYLPLRTSVDVYRVAFLIITLGWTIPLDSHLVGNSVCSSTRIMPLSAHIFYLVSLGTDMHFSVTRHIRPNTLLHPAGRDFGYPSIHHLVALPHTFETRLTSLAHTHTRAPSSCSTRPTLSPWTVRSRYRSRTERMAHLERRRRVPHGSYTRLEMFCPPLHMVNRVLSLHVRLCGLLNSSD